MDIILLSIKFHLRRHEINSSPHSAAYMRQWIGSALVQIMACRQAIILTNAGLYCQLDP